MRWRRRGPVEADVRLPDWSGLVDRESGVVLGDGAPIVVPDVDVRVDDDDVVAFGEGMSLAAARVLDDGGVEAQPPVEASSLSVGEERFVQPALGVPRLRLVQAADDEPDDDDDDEDEEDEADGSGSEWDGLSLFPAPDDV